MLWMREVCTRYCYRRREEKHGWATLESFIVDVVAAPGLSDELHDIFLLRMVPIAAMEKAERANRQRTPRKASR